MADAEHTAHLVRLAAGGDGAAFDELFRLYWPRVYALCLRALGDPDDAADAATGVFLRAWQSLPGLRDPHCFVAWIARGARRACVSAIRQRARAGSHEIAFSTAGAWEADDEAGVSIADTAHADDDISRDAESREFLVAYRECLDALDPVDRFVFIARYEWGWTRLRIGEATGLPEGTARYREERARSAIAACMSAKGLRPETFCGDATGEDVC